MIAFAWSTMVGKSACAWSACSPCASGLAAFDFNDNVVSTPTKNQTWMLISKNVERRRTL